MRLLKKNNFTFILALFGLLFAASPAFAQECEFEEWDANNDSYLDDTEFGDALIGVDYYGDWDEDDDDSLSESEWERGVDEHLGAYDSGKYADWDLNGDGKISENEFHDGLFNLIDDNNDGVIGEDDWDLFSEENDIFC